MSTSATENQDRLRLEILHAYKERLNQDSKVNVSPFGEVVVRYRTDVKECDVPEIHREVRDRIKEIIRSIHQGQPSQVVILSGNPGMGKSHLINYFRQPELAQEQDYILVCNSNHWKPAEFEEALLTWILEALVRPSPQQQHLLLERIQDIGFQALDQILQQPGLIQSYLTRRPGRFLKRMWARFFGSEHDELRQAVDQRDERVFRRLNFLRFSGYVADRFLMEPANSFHRYVMQVLLRYLFPREREKVLHWLRGNEVRDPFLRRLEAFDTINRKYKAIDAIKILISLFTPEVGRGLTGPGKRPIRDRVFFLAFDQMEKPNELFETEADWFKFFAQLSELYNDLPNVFILFTMTLSLRNKLQARMEGQFRDRIRSDQRFTLYEIDDREILGLYRQRVNQWLKDDTQGLRNKLEELGNPYLPFDQVQVLEMGRTETLRTLLRKLDEQFRHMLDAMETDIPLDYMVSLKEFRAEEETMNAYQYTRNHLTTLSRLFQLFGPTLARSAGIEFKSFEWKMTNEKVAVLQFEFRQSQELASWVRFFVVLLPHVYLGKKLESCLKLLSYRQRDRYQLWLVRYNTIILDSELAEERKEQIFPLVIAPETESILRALVHTIERKEHYTEAVWNRGEAFLLGELRKTYLGMLLQKAAKLLAQEAVVTEPEEDIDLIPISQDQMEAVVPELVSDLEEDSES